MKQKFTISFRARNRAIHQARTKSKFRESASDFLARETMCCRIAHNAAFAYQLTPHLKLRLYENDPITFRFQQRCQSRNEQCHRDETDITSNNVQQLPD